MQDLKSEMFYAVIFSFGGSLKLISDRREKKIFVYSSVKHWFLRASSANALIISKKVWSKFLLRGSALLILDSNYEVVSVGCL